VNAEFNWWLLIVGVVGGAGLLWLVLGDWSRREEEVGEAERARESAWIADAMRDEGAAVDPATAQSVLRLHRAWLRETGAYDPLEDELTVRDTDMAPMAADGPRQAGEARPAGQPVAATASGWRDPTPVDRHRPERPAPPGDVG